jgi:hypothetical protein
MQMPHLSQGFSAIASLLDAQPEPVRAMFHYCLALAIVEAGKARLIGQEPGEAGAVCTFETATGEQLSLARPAMTVEMEAEVREMLREILEEGGL